MKNNNRISKEDMKNQLDYFNKHNKIELEYGSLGGKTKYLYFKNRNVYSKNDLILSPSLAYDVIDFIESYIKNLTDTIPIKDHNLILKSSEVLNK